MPPVPVSGPGVAARAVGTAGPPAWLPWLLILLLALAGSLIYVGGLNAPFVFDDLPQIVENPAIRPRGLGEWLASRQPRKLVAATLAINHAIGGLEPTGYHLTNIAIHVLAGLALFGLVHRTLRLPRWREKVGEAAAVWLAFAISLLWLVHPLQTQAVAYTIQRAESMMALFYLLVLYCIARAADSSRPLAWYAGAVGACLLGMASKEVMVTAPLVALLYDRTFVAGSFRRIGRRGWLYGALACTWGFLWYGRLGRTLGVEHLIGSGAAEGGGATTDVSAMASKVTVGFGMEKAGAWEYMLTQAEVIWHYLGLAVWPRTLVLDYGWPFVQHFGEVWLPFLGLGLLFAASAAGLWLCPWAGFLGLSFFLILGPTSSLVPVADAAYEHRMYLPLAALVALAVGAGYALLRRWRLPRGAGMAVVGLAALALAGRTVARVDDYRSATRLWQTVVDARPDYHRAHLNLGAAIFDETGDLERAARHYQRALELEPKNYRAMTNMGTVYWLRGNFQAAESWYRKALEVKPNDAEALFRLGVLARQQGNLAEAERRLRQVLEINPRHLPAMHLLGAILVMRGEAAEGEQLLWRVVAYNDAYAAAWAVLGQWRLQQGRIEEAIELLQKAHERDPDNPEIFNARGLAHAAAGQYAQAADDFSQALQRSADQPGVYLLAQKNFAAAMLAQGNLPLAITAYRQAVDLDPEDPVLLNQLAWLLATAPSPHLRQPGEALELAARAADLAGSPWQILDTLAAAHAANGQFEQAVTTLDAALQQLRAQQAPPEVLRPLQQRRELYRRRQPYTSPTGAR